MIGFLNEANLKIDGRNIFSSELVQLNFLTETQIFNKIT